jgi:hypothetical protein
VTSSSRTEAERPSARGHVAAIALLAAVTLVFFPGVFAGRTYSEVGRFQQIVYPWGNPSAAAHSPRVLHYDQVKSYYPWQVFINRSLRGGEIPLWNPYSFAGTPFLAANANNVLYPPRIALSLLVSAPRVHDLLVASHMFLAGIAMYLLLVYWRASWAGAVLAGVAWMASSFMLAWTALEHFVVVAALLPLAVLLVDASIRRRSWPAAIALGVVLALLFLGGNILFVELCFVLLGAFGAGLLLERSIRAARRNEFRLRSRELRADVARLVVPWLLGIGLSAITLLPTAELVRESARAPLSYSELRDLGLPFSELGNVFVAPNLDEASFLRDPYHTALFGGSLVGLLALVGFGVRRHGAWLARAAAVATLLVALGTPLLALPYWLLPGFANLKPLGRVLFLFAFALAVLAAFGLDAVSSWLSRRFHGRRLAVVAVLVPVAAIGVTVVQLRVYEGGVLNTQPASREHLYPATPLLQRLMDERGSRVLPTSGVLPGSTALVYPLHSALGYESIVPERVQDFWRVVSGVPVAELASVPVESAFEPAPRPDEVRLDLLERAGVELLVEPPGIDTGGRDPARLAPVYDGPDGRLLRVRRALPRAYLVSGCEAAPDARSALVRFQERSFDPAAAVILEEEGLRSEGLDCPPSRGFAGGGARVVAEGVNRMTLELDVPTAGFLVVNETWDAGWHASVDGRDAPVLRANSVFRAIPVAAGAHTVRLRYSPRAYEAGAWISAVTLLATAAACAGLMLRRPASRSVEAGAVRVVAQDRRAGARREG